MQRMDKERLPRKILEWKKKKFVDARSYNMNERKGNYQHGMGGQRIMEKDNKIKTLSTGKCAINQTAQK